MRPWTLVSPIAIVLFCIYRAIWVNLAGADEPGPIDLPTGKTITPTAADGAIFQDLDPEHPEAPDMRAGQAATLAVAPDGRTLAILTTGYNLYYDKDGKLVPALSTEYVFLFDISGSQPKQIQVLPIQNTFEGLAWAPTSERLFASGGSDDTVLEYVRNGSAFAAGRTFHLGHEACAGLSLPSMPLYWSLPPGSPPPTATRKCGPMVGSLAVSPDGTRLLVANNQNDSVSLIDLTRETKVTPFGERSKAPKATFDNRTSPQVAAEQDLRPGIIDPKRHGQPGGSFPRAVVWISAKHAYVASERDREIISLKISGTKIKLVRRMPVHGQPVALLANRSGSRLYVALDTTNHVEIFDTTHDTLIESIDVTAPSPVYSDTKTLGGANTDALVLTPDERTLLVSNGGQNSVAVVRLSDRASGLAAVRPADRDGDGDDDDQAAQSIPSMVIGLVPTGRYPTGIATSKNGATWYVVNYKDAEGPNVVRWCNSQNPPEKSCIPEILPGRQVASTALFDDKTRGAIRSLNENTLRLEKAGFLTLPAPTPLELARLTQQVAHNNHFDRPETAAADDKLFSFLRAHIKHVIYIVKENKTYDEVLGDLDVGNGDPRLTFFPEKITPNHHALARNFVTMDNFLVTGVGSWNGWDWSVSAQTNDFRERSEAVASSISAVKFDAGFQGEPGINRNINMAYATSAERRKYDPLSPTDPDILPGARDIAQPDGPGGAEGKGYIWTAALDAGRTVRNWGFLGGFFPTKWPTLVHDPYAKNLRVYFPTRPSMMSFSDPYYYSFGPAMPDYWRVQEWKREFAEFAAKKSAPNLMLLQLCNDHTGDFARAIDGVNTVDTQVADNDYALGLVTETVANSPFADDTLIISIEDDPLSGLDHVHSFRSVALFAGVYVRQHAVVSARYTTVSVIKTIEEILGIGPIGLNDALAAPMSEVFDPTVTTWSYQAIVPDVLRTTQLPLPPATHAWNAAPRGSNAYWVKAMAGQDFSGPDRIDGVAFTHALWRGLMGGAPYPAYPHSGETRE